MSVEALASAWARREGAPDGAVVVAGTEVAGRLRGGEPWTVGGDDALLMAVVTRPDVDPMREAVLWLPASLAAAETIAVIAGKEGLLRWPDRVVFPRGNPSACAVNVVTQLGPGRIDHSVVSLRVDKQAIAGGGGPVERDDLLIARFVARLRHHLATLHGDPTVLVDAYADRCDLVGRRIRAELLPRGEARGRVAGVDVEGFLVLESSTGMVDRVAPSTLRSLEILGAAVDEPH